jgi:hypothetical protein
MKKGRVYGGGLYKMELTNLLADVLARIIQGQSIPKQMDLAV